MWRTFYEKNTCPESYLDDVKKISTFANYHGELNHDIVLVTSGGTKVPLESRTVRFIDNFSIGTRGSVSTEYFLKEGYAVVFLHRKGSLTPFNRNFTNSSFLELLEKKPLGEIAVKSHMVDKVDRILQEYDDIKKKNMLLMVEYITLSDYLYYLKECAQILNHFERKAVFYLAAAVSDFYIPAEEMPEHKMQSSDGSPNLSLQIVPKMLEPLVFDWAKDAYIVSFKLETNPDILISKACSALEKYKHQAVIGNILETRKKEVHLITQKDKEVITMTENELENGSEIEKKIVTALSKRHSIFKLCE